LGLRFERAEVGAMNRLWRVLLLATALGCAAEVQAQVTIVANANVKANEIGKNELRDVFTGASRSFKDGSHAVPVLRTVGPVQTEFLAKYLGMTNIELGREWRTLLFAGKTAMPPTLDSDEAVIERVAHTPGGIGYVGKVSAQDGVKVLAVK
jgi:ABC-type phosphate transport system substrate-binding protein